MTASSFEGQTLSDDAATAREVAQAVAALRADGRGDVTLIVRGDYVAGDKVAGDKILGNKVVIDTTTAATPMPRARRIVLDKMRAFWIDGVLRRSLEQAALIDIGLASRPDAITPVYPFGIQVADGVDQPLPAATSIVAVFDRFERKLLILGEPGSGKTTLLLELAQGLLARAEADSSHPLPVVFNLSSWGRAMRPLDQWLADELAQQYELPLATARQWIRTSQLLPLLDGLDEVAEGQRDDCVRAINAFRVRFKPEQIAVCCRVADYTAQPDRLVLQGSIVLQPLTPQQVDVYLERAGDALAGVRAALPHDPELCMLAQTPLMLSIVAMAFKGMPASEVALAGKDIAQPRDRLFGAYVKRLLDRPPGMRVYIDHQQQGENAPYSHAQTMAWLQWLARYMHARGESVFFIERLQPDALPERLQRRYHALAALLVGIFVGLLVGVTNNWNVALLWSLGTGLGILLGGDVAQFGTTAWPLWRRLKWGVAVALAITLRISLTINPTAGIASGLLSGLLVAVLVSNKLFNRLAQRVQPRLSVALGVGLIVGVGVGLAEGLRVALPRLLLMWLLDPIVAQQAGVPIGVQAAITGGLGASVNVGLSTGFAVGLLAGLAYQIRPVGRISWAWQPGVAVGLLFGACFALIENPTTGLRLGLTFGLLAGLTGRGIDATVRPNQGIRRSLRNASWGLLIGPVLALSVAFVVGEGGLVVGTVVGLIWTLRSGLTAVLQHSALRLLLRYSGAAPQNYAAFLDQASERLFLRKVGGGYIFVHRLLLEYLAHKPHPPNHDK